MKILNKKQLYKINGGYKRLRLTGTYFIVQNYVEWLFQFFKFKY